jgi:hypothetical protein
MKRTWICISDFIIWFSFSELNQLQNPKQAKCPKHGQPAFSLLEKFEYTKTVGIIYKNTENVNLKATMPPSNRLNPSEM